MRGLADAVAELVAVGRSHTRISERAFCLGDLANSSGGAWYFEHERLARAFEQHVATRLLARTGRRNDTLACYPEPEDLDSPAQVLAVHPYPTPAEGDVLAPQFDALVAAGRACGILRGPGPQRSPAHRHARTQAAARGSSGPSM